MDTTGFGEASYPKLPKVKTAAELRELLRRTDEENAKKASSEGRLSVRERLNSLFDERTFTEIGSYVKRIPTELDEKYQDEFEGVICGYGAVDGRLVFAFAQDFYRMKGALDEQHAKKICALYDMALKNGAPVIGIFDSAGAVIFEGVSALAGYSKVMKCISDASGVVPQIAIVPGICAGSAAVAASMFDFLIAVEGKSSIYVNSPFLLNNAGDDNYGSAKYAKAAGLASVVVANESEAFVKARNLLNYLPSNNTEGTVMSAPSDGLNRLTDTAAIISKEGYDIRDVISEISDYGDYTELYAGYSDSLVTCFAIVGGASVGICANAASVNDGRITSGAARKAARFISFCDSFDIPLLTLVDSAGLEISAAEEGSPYASELAKLAFAYSSSKNAKVSVVLNKAYGAAYTIMCPKSLGADIAYALDTAQISVLPPASAVAFAWTDRKSTTDASALEEQWTASIASPFEAARRGEIDDIIDSTELRQRICAAFSMLAAKSAYGAKRRHANMPL